MKSRLAAITTFGVGDLASTLVAVLGVGLHESNPLVRGLLFGMDPVVGVGLWIISKVIVFGVAAVLFSLIEEWSGAPRSVGWSLLAVIGSVLTVGNSIQILILG